MASVNGHQTVLDVDSVVTRFGDHTVHNGISFSVERGTILAVIGASGCGKSTLLREVIRLQEPTAGRLVLFGQDVWGISREEMEQLRQRFGVLFQNGALFSALTVGENIAAPIVEQTTLSKEIVECIVQLRLALVGLSCDTAAKMPSELSGGMRKRVALARALALEPEVLFLDEPTSGLDPIGARAFDELIHTLSRSLGLTIFMVTHDLDSIIAIADRVIVLGEGTILADGNVDDVVRNPHPWIKEYFSSRTRA